MRLPSLLLAGCLLAAAPSPAKPTNLVFILTDNQGAWTLGCYGNPDIRTPHIDRLATGGLRFNRALSSNPVCSPTRASHLPHRPDAVPARRALLPRPEVHDGPRGLQHPGRVPFAR